MVNSPSPGGEPVPGMRSLRAAERTKAQFEMTILKRYFLLFSRPRGIPTPMDESYRFIGFCGIPRSRQNKRRRWGTELLFASPARLPAIAFGSSLGGFGMH